MFEKLADKIEKWNLTQEAIEERTRAFENAGYPYVSAHDLAKKGYTVETYCELDETIQHNLYFEKLTGNGAVFEWGDLFLGRYPLGNNSPIGITHDRHCLTVAGARTGKGATTIIPNLLTWQGNALVIDPKGENAEATARYRREVLGQNVYVIDPFNDARIPDEYRASLNPLDGIDQQSVRAFSNIKVIADGLIMRHDPRGGHWDGGAESVLSGLIAYVLASPKVKNRSLIELRRILNDAENFNAVIDDMGQMDAFGQLGKTAYGKLMNTGNEAGHFLSGATENTKWLDDPAMENVLSSSSFSMRDLKTKPTTVYLVLPVDLLDIHGRFLRLFVRTALSAMAAKMDDGSLKGEETLFLLDEFYSLGYISEIAKSAGAMPGYGVKLWPIIQDVGQIDELYGREGWGAFTGNAGLVQFFGNNDSASLDRLVETFGTNGQGIAQQHFTPQRVKHAISKPVDGKIAKRSINFVSGYGRPLLLKPTAYFDDPWLKSLLG